MNTEIYEALNGIFREVMDNDSISVAPETTAADIPQWDSLTHVMLVVAVEKHFKVRFAATEVQKLQNVGELVGLIERHAAS
jgi:acyl carrier protein